MYYVYLKIFVLSIKSKEYTVVGIHEYQVSAVRAIITGTHYFLSNMEIDVKQFTNDTHKTPSLAIKKNVVKQCDHR